MMYKKILLSLQKYYLVKKAISVNKKNSIKLHTLLRASKIRIKGEGNSIELKKGSFKRVKITIEGNNNLITIDKDVVAKNIEIIIRGSNHTFSIGSGTEVGGASVVLCGQNSKIEIGKNCLLASGISFKSCDGHAIYHNSKVINNSKSIAVSDNVWIAQDVTFLKGSAVGRDSVVGMNSLVLSQIDETNIILAGSPAKILKRDITWGKEATL